MQSEIDQIYYAITKNGYVLINDNDYDYSQDIIVIELMKKYKKVVVGDAFNQSIDFLPNGITYLRLGRRFNKPIMNLPQTLKHLIIGAIGIAYCDFNQSLDNLPEDIETLELIRNSKFDKYINNLPFGLKHLHFNCTNFNYPINNLPEGLETLVVRNFNNLTLNNLPSNLKSVQITSNLSKDNAKLLKEYINNSHSNINFDVVLE
jgi:hypothetical protein